MVYIRVIVPSKRRNGLSPLVISRYDQMSSEKVTPQLLIGLRICKGIKPSSQNPNAIQSGAFGFCQSTYFPFLSRKKSLNIIYSVYLIFTCYIFIRIYGFLQVIK